ncbi:hypothetical protein APLC1_2986 [Limnospira platensis C1]|nr:hypothetical protein APLC1_2986 [Arthrospira platensis C1]
MFCEMPRFSGGASGGWRMDWRRLGLSCVTITWFLVGCDTPMVSVPPNQLEQDMVPVFSQGQMLPITAKAMIGDREIQLEVARTPEQQTLGLMFRTFLPDNRGMLFVFARPEFAQFWMKNCKIPLDMIFMRDGVVRYIQVNALPCEAEPCPTYGPTNVMVDKVIELRGGLTEELGLQLGDRISVRFLKSP